MTSPRRIQLRRTKGWRKPPGAIIVARPTRWGNPFVVGCWEVETFRYTGPSFGAGAGYYDPNDVRWCDTVLTTNPLDAAQAVALYRDDIEASLNDDDDELREALDALRGHDLACWCDLASPCHADVLLELANR